MLSVCNYILIRLLQSMRAVARVTHVNESHAVMRRRKYFTLLCHSTTLKNVKYSFKAQSNVYIDDLGRCWWYVGGTHLMVSDRAY